MVTVRKIRLDQLVLDRGWAESCDKAQRIIRAGQVRRGTDILDKPGLKLPEDTALECTALHDRFVSRGGWKLQKAIELFQGLTPCPAVCADIGSSTGGFTDCLLQHGAQHIYAIDVGTSQLCDKMRADPRVTVMEKTNARHLKPDDLPEAMDLLVADVSFISLEIILPPTRKLLSPQGQAVVLVKPQFEALPKFVEKGGVVRKPEIHQQVLECIAIQLPPTIDMQAIGLEVSPLKGPAGNREYLLWLVSLSEQNDQTPIDKKHIEKIVKQAFEK